MDYGAVDPKFVNYLNVPFVAHSVSPLQLIERLTRQNVDKSLSSLFYFFVPSTSFLAIIAAGILLYLVASVLFSRFGKPSTPSRLSLPTGKKLQLKIVSFFYMLFMFFNGQFFGGNLNTENIVVRTDDFLYSKDQILETQKEFCGLEEGAETDIYKNVS